MTISVFDKEQVKPTRVGHKIAEDGAKERICKKCGATI